MAKVKIDLGAWYEFSDEVIELSTNDTFGKGYRAGMKRAVRWIAKHMKKCNTNRDRLENLTDYEFVNWIKTAASQMSGEELLEWLRGGKS